MHPSLISHDLCYHTVEGSETFIDGLISQSSDITGLFVNKTRIGESFENRTLWALNITGEAERETEKGILFLVSGLHPREMAPPQLVSLWAQMLVDNYGSDPDLTALVDHTEIHMIIHANPDGRIKAETDDIEEWNMPIQRKNRNTGEKDCSVSFSEGVDLNRNFPFGEKKTTSYEYELESGETRTSTSTSDEPCSSNFYGYSSPEKETESIMNYARVVFNESDESYDPRNGVFLDLHSYGSMILWPTTDEMKVEEDEASYSKIAAQFADISGYDARRSIYPTWGGSSSWFYGEKGLMSFTLEVGGVWPEWDTKDGFWLDCGTFQDTEVGNILPLLTYAARISRRPRDLPKGPHVESLIVDSPEVQVISENPDVEAPNGDLVVTVSTSNTLVDNVRLSIDIHPYDVAGVGSSYLLGNMHRTSTPGQWSFNASIEELDIFNPGKHNVYIEAVDDKGQEGPVKAAWQLLIGSSHIQE